MYHVRLAAALLAAATVLVAVLIGPGLGVGADVVASCVGAALCLAAIVPFRARRPAARDRVVVAVALHVCATGAALILASLAGAAPIAVSALVTVTIAGCALLVWAARTRRTPRRSAWANYFD